MRANVNRAAARDRHRTQKRAVIMAAIHAPQGFVVDRFDTELQRDEGLLRQVIDHLNFVLVHAVGSRADG